MSINRKIRVGAVSYLNTKPLIYGFEQGMMKDQVELVTRFPARLADLLLSDEIDVGLVPVAVIPSLKEAHIITDHCIGSDGPVASVCIFSEVPLSEIETVLMDYQSRSSVRLGKILLRNYWKVSPEIKDGGKDFRERIGGATAGLVIGDRALEERQNAVFIYDLGEAWKDFTGLPFVFAAWVANKQLPEDFINDFRKATAYGFEHLDRIVAANPYALYDLKKYYTENISFALTPEKREGMKKFLQLIAS